MRTCGSYISGIALRVAGLTLELLGIIVVLQGFVFIPEMKSLAPASGLLTVLGGLTVWLGYKVALGGRRRISRRVLSDQQFPDGSFVLYLRSFSDDDDRQRMDARLSDVPFNTITNWVMASGLTEEEQLVAALHPAGPVLTVGNPGDQRSYAGAWRLDLPAAEWQPRIVAAMRRARLVVLTVGTGHWLVWEYAQAIQHVEPQRLMLAVFPGADAYDQFRKLAAEEIAAMRRASPPALPAHPAHTELAWHPGTGRTGPWFIRFDENWSAKRILPQGKYGRNHGRNYVKTSFRNALSEVFPALIAADMAVGRTAAARQLSRTLERREQWSQLRAELTTRLLKSVPFTIFTVFFPGLSPAARIILLCVGVGPVLISVGRRAWRLRQQSRLK